MSFFTGFEKRALEKRAYDSDFEEDDEYGIVANRNITEDGAHHLQDSLAKAAKDPHLKVSIFGPGLQAHSDDPENFQKALTHIRQKVGPKNPASLPNGHMDWHRHYDWSISAKKSNPIFTPKKGELDEFDNPHTVHSKITDYIFSKYKV